MFLVVPDAIAVDAYRRASFVAFTAALLSLALLLRIKTSDLRANVAEKGKAGRRITCVKGLAACELVGLYSGSREGIGWLAFRGVLYSDWFTRQIHHML